MRNRIDEGVVLLITADLPDQKNGVEDHAADDDGEQQHPQEKQDTGAPIEENPANIEEKNDEDQRRAQRNEERNGPLSSADHNFSLAVGKASGLSRREAL